MTEQPPPPRGSAAEFNDRRNVRLYDLTQPLIVNKTPVCQAVAELLRLRPRTPRIAELGCGTGLCRGGWVAVRARPSGWSRRLRLPLGTE
jgi:hypothetical protein